MAGMRGAEAIRNRVPFLRNTHDVIHGEQFNHLLITMTMGMGSPLALGLKAEARVAAAAGEIDLLMETEAQSIAMGLSRLAGRSPLFELASQTKSLPYTEWFNAGLTDVNLAATSDFSVLTKGISQSANKSGQINFALDGLMNNIPAALVRGAQGNLRNNITNVELHMIYHDPSLYGKTNFFIEGRAVSPLPKPNF